RRLAAVEKRRDLRVRVDIDEAGAELVALADVDQPGVVFRAGMAGGEQFLQHDRHFDAVGRAQRIELQRMAADRQRLFVRGAGDRAVDAGEAAAALFVPDPDFRRDVFGVGHAASSWKGEAVPYRIAEAD